MMHILLALTLLLAGLPIGEPPPDVVDPPLVAVVGSVVAWQDTSNADALALFAPAQRLETAPVPRPADGAVALAPPVGWRPTQELGACRLWYDGAGAVRWWSCTAVYTPYRVYLPFTRS
jgi:hypothetical protein